MDGVRPISSPSYSNNHSIHKKASYGDSTLNQSTIGALHYITITKTRTNFCSQLVMPKMHDLSTKHLTIVKQILIYLK